MGTLYPPAEVVLVYRLGARRAGVGPTVYTKGLSARVLWCVYRVLMAAINEVIMVYSPRGIIGVLGRWSASWWWPVRGHYWLYTGSLLRRYPWPLRGYYMRVRDYYYPSSLDQHPIPGSACTGLVGSPAGTILAQMEYLRRVRCSPG